MKKLLLFCLATFGLVACNDDLRQEYPSAKMKSFHLIDCYQPWDYVELETYTNSQTGAQAISVYFNDDTPCNEVVSSEYAAVWNKSSKQTYVVSSEGFDALAAKNNDEGYEWDVLVVYDIVGTTASAIHCHTALERGLKKIEVVSDSDFDKEHPAGTSLNDVVKFCGMSYSQFLIDDADKSKVNVDDRSLGAMEKLCSALTELDLKVLNGSAALQFVKNPTLSKKHNITVTMTDIDGEVFTDTVEVNF